MNGAYGSSFSLYGKILRDKFLTNMAVLKRFLHLRDWGIARASFLCAQDTQRQIASTAPPLALHTNQLAPTVASSLLQVRRPCSLAERPIFFIDTTHAAFRFHHRLCQIRMYRRRPSQVHDKLGQTALQHPPRSLHSHSHRGRCLAPALGVLGKTGPSIPPTRPSIPPTPFYHVSSCECDFKVC
jgi:hypothetical protein